MTSKRRLIVRKIILLTVSLIRTPCYAFSNQNSVRTCYFTRLPMKPPLGGIVVDGDQNNAVVMGLSIGNPSEIRAPFSFSPMERAGINSQGAKMNEIDFTLAPSDVSLSRCYQMSKDGMSTSSSLNVEFFMKSNQTIQEAQEQRVQTLSLTRALNTASNRVVRRILLARSWPSAEALNLSLKTILAQNQQQDSTENKEDSPERDNLKAKCPVPRPILNVIMKRRYYSDNTSTRTNDFTDSISDLKMKQNPIPRNTAGDGVEKERQWVEAQILLFRELYKSIPDYDQAEIYLDCILSLATAGVESDKVDELMKGGLYVESYERVLSVIQSVGAILENLPGSSKRRISPNLLDQDICLSMFDKISLKNEKTIKQNNTSISEKEEDSLVISPNATNQPSHETDLVNKMPTFFEEDKSDERVATKEKKKNLAKLRSTERNGKERKIPYKEGNNFKLFSSLLSMANFTKKELQIDKVVGRSFDANAESDGSKFKPGSFMKSNELGGVLLSAEEPTPTRQLNILSNVVLRTLMFGGDQELLVLSETLDADKPAFIKRWYKNNPIEIVNIQDEHRPGVQYLNSLILLLRECYTKGVIFDVNPTLPLTTGYQNAYGRLTASLIKLGSGYVRPSRSTSSLSLALSTPMASAKYLTSTKPPKSVLEEVRRFARWESAVRKDRINPYPEDLVGIWNVQDVVSGSVIGTSQVSFKPLGEVKVLEPMQGLRWRLDPGPTHLDTCTFQVLSNDGSVLQYRGYVDRGSRLEARLSKRSLTICGGVSFLMRDVDIGREGSYCNDYWDDMLPMNFKSGTTKFIMSRIVDVNSGA